ncbi:MAG: glycosyltransferase, partial [Polaribacter sp.]
MIISVIIPVYNEQKNLVKRLSFLSKQTNKFPIEIIVSNSLETTDKSAEVCKNFDKVTYFESEKKGRASQMNFGAQKAKGNVLLFLHTDVALPKDFYEQIINAVKSGNKAGFFAYKFDRKSFLLDLNSSFTKRDGLFTGGGDQCH